MRVYRQRGGHQDTSSLRRRGVNSVAAVDATPADREDAAMEAVVLLDERGAAVGATLKKGVHKVDTPLHLGFSCYMFDRNDRLLITRRALSKVTWPGVWSNSCCGHPLPGEPLQSAVARRVGAELGMSLCRLVLLLPKFRYVARMSNGLVEREMCPVFAGWSDDRPRLNREEVIALRWLEWRKIVRSVLSGRSSLSPWSCAQVGELSRLDGIPSAWQAARWDELPPAART